MFIRSRPFAKRGGAGTVAVAIARASLQNSWGSDML